jgi:hypothetical protein
VSASHRREQCLCGCAEVLAGAAEAVLGGQVILPLLHSRVTGRLDHDLIPATSGGLSQAGTGHTGPLASALLLSFLRGGSLEKAEDGKEDDSMHSNGLPTPCKRHRTCTEWHCCNWRLEQDEKGVKVPG